MPIKPHTGEASDRVWLSLLLAIIYVKHLAKSLAHDRSPINCSPYYWYWAIDYTVLFLTLC